MKLLTMLLLAAAMAGGGATWALARSGTVMRTILVPTNQMGQEVHPTYSGAKYARKVTSSEELIVAGPVVLLGLQLATGANGMNVQIRDTASADGGTNGKVFKISYAATPNTTPNQVAYPTRFNSGIVISVLGSSTAAVEDITVLYLLQQ